MVHGVEHGEVVLDALKAAVEEKLHVFRQVR